MQLRREPEICVRLCCWLMSAEGSGRSLGHKGNPGRTVKSSIRVGSAGAVSCVRLGTRRSNRDTNRQEKELPGTVSISEHAWR